MVLLVIVAVAIQGGRHRYDTATVVVSVGRTITTTVELISVTGVANTLKTPEDRRRRWRIA